MPINPSMLALSIANPGLLPLAFEQDYSPYQSMKTHHTHSHAHTHEFKQGSGEEMRGIEVSKEVALSAYLRALAECEKWEVDNREEISKFMLSYETFLQKRKDEQEEVQREDERKKKNYEKNEERKKEIESIKKNPHGWFGLSFKQEQMIQAIQVEIQKAKNQYLHIDYHHRYFYEYDGYSIEHEIKKIKNKIKEKKVIAELAVNSLHLSREDVLEIGMINNGFFKNRLNNLFR